MSRMNLQAKIQINNEKLKQYIKDFSNKHLELSRQNVAYVQQDQNPLKFYIPLEKKYDMNWQKVGTAISVSTTDDTIYNFFQRAALPPFTEENFEYSIEDSGYKSVNIVIPSLAGRKIRSGEKFIIPGKESIGEFELVRDKDYIPIFY